MKPLDIVTIISLPTPLRKTALAMVKLGEATIDQVSAETGRNEKIEGNHLRDLFKLKYLRKKRIGKRILYFTFLDF
jgi:hypothetical protein